MDEFKEVRTCALAPGETNDEFFEQIASLDVDYAEVERRFMSNPKMFEQEVLFEPFDLEPRHFMVEEAGNRKQRRAARARNRDKRWRIKL